MKRIKLIKNQLKSHEKNIKIISSALDYFKFGSFFTEEENNYLNELKNFLETEIKPKMAKLTENQIFPAEIFKIIIQNFPGIMGLFLQGYGSLGCSFQLACVILMEFARCDLSLATFLMVNGGTLIMKAIYEFGSEEQKEKYLPKFNNLEMIGSFCLTEPEHGSDASNIKTTASVINDSIIINGEKRWIGNSDVAQILIVWAKNGDNIEGFIVETDRPGVNINKMEGKLSTRSVHNCEIKFENVKIPLSNKLEKTSHVRNASHKMLFASRLAVAWLAVGACIGAYDTVIKYCSNRKQFGKPVTSFQLIQEKLGRIMADSQAMLYFTKRATDLYTAGNSLSMGMISMVKAWCTSKARETIRLAREIMGGNGILSENYVMRALVDIESLYTYEGTYDINMLVSGKELTGISAVK
jgi:alkylation response protein AidB-like acyl-CoA dehydrogenase